MTINERIAGTVSMLKAIGHNWLCDANMIDVAYSHGRYRVSVVMVDDRGVCGRRVNVLGFETAEEAAAARLAMAAA